MSLMGLLVDWTQHGILQARILGWVAISLSSDKVWSEWCEVAQSCLTLCDPMDCNPPGSSVHGILQAKILELVAISSFRGSSRPRDKTQVFCIARRFFSVQATREAPQKISEDKIKPVIFLIFSLYNKEQCLQNNNKQYIWLCILMYDISVCTHPCLLILMYKVKWMTAVIWGIRGNIRSILPLQASLTFLPLIYIFFLTNWRILATVH